VEESGSRLLEVFCSLIVAQSGRKVLKGFRSDAGSKMVRVAGGRLKTFVRDHDLILGIGFFDLAFGIDGLDSEVARAVEVQVGIQEFGIEAIDGGGVFLGDMARRGLATPWSRVLTRSDAGCRFRPEARHLPG